MIEARKFTGSDGLWYVTLHANAGNHEPLFRSTDGYVDERDADRAVAILESSGLEVAVVEVDVDG
jgi:uncharacterized protein YegP (UPF0339 family)